MIHKVQSLNFEVAVESLNERIFFLVLFDECNFGITIEKTVRLKLNQ